MAVRNARTVPSGVVVAAGLAAAVVAAPEAGGALDFAAVDASGDSLDPQPDSSKTAAAIQDVWLQLNDITILLDSRWAILPLSSCSRSKRRPTPGTEKMLPAAGAESRRNRPTGQDGLSLRRDGGVNAQIAQGREMGLLRTVERPPASRDATAMLFNHRWRTHAWIGRVDLDQNAMLRFPILIRVRSMFEPVAQRRTE